MARKALNSNTGPEEQLLAAKAVDSAFLCLKKGAPVFTDFCNPISAKIVARSASGVDGVSFSMFGGRENCERMIVCLCPEGCTDISFPIKALYIDSSRFNKSLTHRDFLGALIGLGIDRGKIGDIFVEDGNAVVFVREEIADFIISELTGVGRVSVRVSEYKDGDFVFEKDGKIIRLTVPSMRLDAVLGEAFNLSRSKAQNLIRAEKVFLNWEVKSGASQAVKVNDVISAKGLGRAVIKEICGESKKGRIFIEIERF